MQLRQLVGLIDELDETDPLVERVDHQRDQLHEGLEEGHIQGKDVWIGERLHLSFCSMSSLLRRTEVGVGKVW